MQIFWCALLMKKIFTVDSTPVDSMLLWPGGDAQNESCVMAKLGMKTALVGKIGPRYLGDAIVDIVTKSGVDLSHVVRDDMVNTCTSVALIFLKMVAEIFSIKVVVTMPLL